MNRDDIIHKLGWNMGWVTESDLLDRVERIVRLAEVAEREACARVCENIEDHDETIDDIYYSDHYANAIRARGDEPKRHPGYIIGDHWLQAAYTRVCTGEDIRQVMEDYGYYP